MPLQVDLDHAYSDPSIPAQSDIESWIEKSIELQSKRPAAKNDAEVSIRIVDDAEISELNQQYRNKLGPTNVLSFPCDLPDHIEVPLLGDIIISAPTVLEEAQAQNKPAQAHWAHLFVHGTLHLLGYDHQTDEEATEMEQLERIILQAFGYPDPYHTTQNQAEAFPQSHPLQPPSC